LKKVWRRNEGDDNKREKGDHEEEEEFGEDSKEQQVDVGPHQRMDFHRG
jgi:hypothetical protein